MSTRDVGRPTARSSRWLVVGVALTAFGLVLTHVPGAAGPTTAARAGPRRMAAGEQPDPRTSVGGRVLVGRPLPRVVATSGGDAAP